MSRNPTLKRILKESAELAAHPSPDFTAAPLESDLYEWHFTLRGPPAPSPFDAGIYHGRIVLPPAYPLKPPSFRFLTPTGRFEVNREICLSISGHHEETWQPAWGIRTALVAIRSFMDSDARGQVGGMDASEEVRKRLAGTSRVWRCGVCQRRNEEILKEVEIAAGDGGQKEEVPEELRLAYREDLGKGGEGKAEANERPSDLSAVADQKQQSLGDTLVPRSQPQALAAAPSSQPRRDTSTRQRSQTQIHHPQQAGRIQQQHRATQPSAIPSWIDAAIFGVMAMLFFLILRKFVL